MAKHGIRLDLKRFFIFTALLFFCWCLPAIFIYFKFFSKHALFEKSILELIVLPTLAMLAILVRYRLLNNLAAVQAIVLIALVPNMLYFSTFNPIQSAQPIFAAKNSEEVAGLKKLEQQDSRGWLVLPNIPGAILNGLGLKSFTHVLIQPQLAFFRVLFPDMPLDRFNQTFNRYAHIQLSNIQTPDSPQADVVRIPIKKIIRETAIREVNISFTDCNTNAASAGILEAIVLDNKKLYISGWIFDHDHRYLTNLKTSKFISYLETPDLNIPNANLHGFSPSSFSPHDYPQLTIS
jgi:hypothetical protein